jgi:integrase
MLPPAEEGDRGLDHNLILERGANWKVVMASIRKRTWKSGSETRTAWIADYFDQGGKRRQKTFATRKAADAWLVQTRREVQQGTHTPESTSITVAEASVIWLERGELEGLERSTLRQYRIHVDLHILPLLGTVKLARLSTPALEAFRDALLRKGGRAMARKALASLKGILTEAQRRGLIAHNPASPVRVDLKKREAGKLKAGRDIPSKEEIQTILAAATGRWRPFLVSATFTGMRASELRGLTWDAVDFQKKNHPRSPARRQLGNHGRTENGGWQPRDPDVADGGQHAARMAVGLPEGPAQSRLPQRHRQGRGPRQHHSSWLVRIAAADRHRRRGGPAAIWAALAAPPVRLLGDRAGLLAEAAASAARA